ncbi:MAG: malto-oligosyltrehalose synthase, partial [Alphaproteobacteria bacterium]|nr:malto-oligosyltrehalose synthase [Alphaproteobacteria bacterium]
MIPRATYRVQFHRNFTFEQGARLARYLGTLGISHLYASPILKARAGSLHGYDVVDHRRINPELGGEDGFNEMSKALRQHGIGIILDIVPNHMAVGGADNPWWLDVLENGPDSRFARYFDIDWCPPGAALRNKVLAPFLGRPYQDVLQSGEISLLWDETLGRVCFAYYDHRFPLRRSDYAEVCAEAAPHVADLSRFNQPHALHTLLERQHYRLAWWRTASDQINWRRFFTINTLAALRVEDPQVFEAVHATVLDLFARGLIDGVRIDHVDGLTHPGRYCRHLRAQLGARAAERPALSRDTEPYIVVEKILAPGETLCRDWQVEGTTGYDVMNSLSALQHEPDGAAPLASLWARMSLRPADFAPEERLARRQVLLSAFEGPLAAAARAAQELMPGSVQAHDVTEPALRRALISVIEEFRAYRTYATGEAESVAAGSPFWNAIAAARARAVAVDQAAVDYLGQVIDGQDYPPSPAREQAVRLFNQLTAPVAAKAVEDTAFYRYGRLLSRTDVGFDPDTFSLSSAQFHDQMCERAGTYPHALCVTATHDHKRGEDQRARLAVLSQVPQEWARAVRQWFALNATFRSPLVGSADEYMLYQTLVGVWPLQPPDELQLVQLRQRILGWREKSLREAKLNTSWADPDDAFERAHADFVSALLDPRKSAVFLNSLNDFVKRIAPAGALNALVQCALRCLLPGVPDCYQGTELWDFSLVDPDNRRAVNYDVRKAMLDSALPPVQLLESWKAGTVKLALLRELLALRSRYAALFEKGDYVPLAVEGRRRTHVLAFRRQH